MASVCSATLVVFVFGVPTNKPEGTSPVEGAARAFDAFLLQKGLRGPKVDLNGEKMRKQKHHVVNQHLGPPFGVFLLLLRAHVVLWRVRWSCCGSFCILAVDPLIFLQ